MIREGPLSVSLSDCPLAISLVPLGWAPVQGLVPALSRGGSGLKQSMG
jgi:hypothetical protein